MIAIITGGTGGIGHCLSEGFSRAGYQVIAIDYIQHRPLSESIDFIQLDLTDVDALQRTFDTIKAKYGTAHVLINNAAIASYKKSFQEVTPEAWDRILDTNLRAAFFASQAFVALNQGASYGRIINIASTRWHQNEAHHDVYGASKGGLVSLTNSLCVSLSGSPVTVNAISPGWIETGDYDALTLSDHSQHPTGRVGKPEDIFRACLFLADPLNDFINGVNLLVDGGMTKRMFYLE